MEKEVKVWIDQDLCTGDGLCTDIAPDVFGLKEDGLAYVKDEDGFVDERIGQAGATAVAIVPGHLWEDTAEAEGDCPGSCIFLEITEA